MAACDALRCYPGCVRRSGSARTDLSAVSGCGSASAACSEKKNQTPKRRINELDVAAAADLTVVWFQEEKVATRFTGGEKRKKRIDGGTKP